MNYFMRKVGSGFDKMRSRGSKGERLGATVGLQSCELVNVQCNCSFPPDGQSVPGHWRH